MGADISQGGVVFRGPEGQGVFLPFPKTPEERLLLLSEVNPENRAEISELLNSRDVYEVNVAAGFLKKFKDTLTNYKPRAPFRCSVGVSLFAASVAGQVVACQHEERSVSPVVVDVVNNTPVKLDGVPRLGVYAPTVGIVLGAWMARRYCIPPTGPNGNGRNGDQRIQLDVRTRERVMLEENRLPIAVLILTLVGAGILIAADGPAPIGDAGAAGLLGRAGLIAL